MEQLDIFVKPERNDDGECDRLVILKLNMFTVSIHFANSVFQYNQ